MNFFALFLSEHTSVVQIDFEARRVRLLQSAELLLFFLIDSLQLLMLLLKDLQFLFLLLNLLFLHGEGCLELLLLDL